MGVGDYFKAMDEDRKARMREFVERTMREAVLLAYGDPLHFSSHPWADTVNSLTTAMDALFTDLQDD